ncbi:MAG: VOC family protein [Acidithiobacillales bacterium]
MPQLDAYLVFDGNCADAMRFYERTLGGKLEMLMTHAQSPLAAQMPPESADRIMHARLALGDRILMGSDAPLGQPAGGMKGFSLSLICPTAAEAKRLFEALADGGKVTMPLQKTFWAEAFGMLVDRFGTPWMVSGSMTPM